MTDVILKDAVLDGGLEVLNTLATAIWVCDGTPTDYADAQTKELGFKTFGAGNAFGSPANATPDGRQVTSFPVTDGTVNVTGTVTCWAAVDVVNTQLLAVGDLTGGMAVTAGWAWTLDAFTIRMPSTEATSGYDADTDVWISAVETAGGTVSDTQGGYVDELILGLKADGLFTLAEGLWLFANESDTDQAQIDIINLNVGSTVGSLVYGPQGIHDGGSTNSAFDTGIASGSNYTTNSGSLGVVQIGGYNLDAVADGQTQIGASATVECGMRLTWSVPRLESRLNSSAALHNSTTTSPSNSPTQGVFMVSRTSSTAMAAYRDGTQLDTWSDTAAGVPSQNLSCLARKTGSSTYDSYANSSLRMAAAWIGAGLDATQAAAFNTRICAYLAHYHIIPTVVNHVTKSQDFDHADWNKAGVSVTANDTTAPDGTTTADLIYANTSGSYASEIYQTNVGDSIATSFRLSVYVKPHNWTWVALRAYDGSNNTMTWFDLSGSGDVGTVGSLISDPTITDAGSGWFLISMAMSINPGSNPRAELFLVDADGSGTVTNSGTDGVWAWGIQMVYGSTHLPYSRSF